MDKQLPKRVVFKGDNGNYMAAVTPPGEDHVFLQFYVNPEDKHDLRCSHTIHTNSDGTIRIESDYYGKFWRLSPNWIWADSDDRTSNNRDTLFRPIKLDGDGMYALQNVSNGNYCKRLTADYKQSCLNASSPSIHREARLKMEEAVISRRIYDVHYRFEDAKIFGQKPITLITQDATNHGSTDNKEKIALKFETSKETTWDSSTSIKLGVTTSIEAGFPEVVSISVEVSTEFTSSYTWGETVTRTQEHSSDYEVTVPPNTMVSVRMLATQATCEVPFSYSQEDVLSSGDKVVYKFDDGVYRGVNSYGFNIDVSEKKLN